MTRFALALLLATLASSAQAQAPLITGLGGPLDFGTSTLARGNDDPASTPIDLTTTFPGGIDFYGAHYTSVYVNINGALTFGSALATFAADPFPRASGTPMIAVWWADVDTRTVPADPTSNQVYFAETAEHFVVTWIDVGYFDQHIDALDAFQIVLSPGGATGTFEAELRYHRCEWTTGDNEGGVNGLGGIPAQAGFDAGDGVQFLALPGSRSDAMLDLCTRSNLGAGMGGVWRLPSVQPAPVCGNGSLETGETCDDGNTYAYDGCDGTCQVAEPCLEPFPDGGIANNADAAVDASVDASLGVCVLPDAGTDAGSSDAGDLDGGDVDAGTDAALEDGGRRNDAGVRFDAGPFFRDAAARPDTGIVPDRLDITGSGCGCRAGARSSGRIAWLALALIALVVRRRRRSAGCAAIGTSAPSRASDSGRAAPRPMRCSRSSA